MGPFGLQSDEGQTDAVRVVWTITVRVEGGIGFLRGAQEEIFIGKETVRNVG